MNVKVLAFFNHKGGVSKTTSNFIIGNLLASDSHSRVKKKHIRKGEKVLFVDLDFQRNLTNAVLRNENVTIEGGAIESIASGDASEFIIQSQKNPNIYLLPATKSLSLFDDFVFENELNKREGYEKLLEMSLERFVKENDIRYVVVDTAPNASKLLIQGLNLSFGGDTNAIIPFPLDEFGSDSLELAAETVSGIVGSSNPNLKVIGIVATLLQKTEKSYKKTLGKVKVIYEDLLFESVIFSKSEIKNFTNEKFEEKFSHQRGALEMYYGLLSEIKERI